MRKQIIPSADQPTQALTSIKQNLDIITGRIGGELKLLSSTATTTDIINKINEIAVRLNAST